MFLFFWLFFLNKVVRLRFFFFLHRLRSYKVIWLEIWILNASSRRLIKIYTQWISMIILMRSSWIELIMILMSWYRHRAFSSMSITMSCSYPTSLWLIYISQSMKPSKFISVLRFSRCYNLSSLISQRCSSSSSPKWIVSIKVIHVL